MWEALFTFFVICLFIFGILFIYVKYNSSSKKQGDKIVEFHKYKVRQPTWRFQKFHPSRCPHNNGIFRKVNGEKVFVCADCIDIINLEEVSDRNKFKIEMD